MKRLVLMLMAVMSILVSCTSDKADQPKPKYNQTTNEKFVEKLKQNGYTIHNDTIIQGHYDKMQTDKQFVFSVKRGNRRETLVVFQYDLNNEKQRNTIKEIDENGVTRNGHHGTYHDSYIRSKNLLLEKDTSHVRWNDYVRIFKSL